MTGKTHQIVGISLGLGSFLTETSAIYNPATFAAVLAVSSIGALVPDIDSHSAQIWQTLPFGRFVGQVVDPLIAHRNFSHSILGTAFFGYLFYKLISLAPAYWGLDHQLILITFIASYASHLLADMVTVEGVPLFFPYQRMFGIPPHPFEGVRIVTGKWFENLIVFPLANLVLILIIANQWPKIHEILFK